MSDEFLRGVAFGMALLMLAYIIGSGFRSRYQIVKRVSPERPAKHTQAVGPL